MKKLIIKSITALSLIVLLGSHAFAGDKAPVTEFKSLGVYNRQPVFELAIQQANAQQVTIVVKDEEGTVLHEELVSGNYINRKYMLNTLELGSTTVIFEVYNASGVLTATYKVRNHQLVK